MPEVRSAIEYERRAELENGVGRPIGVGTAGASSETMVLVDGVGGCAASVVTDPLYMVLLVGLGS